MTPTAILEMVKLRFVPLLHDEDVALNALLKQTLLTYQDLAGVIKTYTIPDKDSTTLPDHFLVRIAVKDSDLDFVSSTADVENNQLLLSLNGYESYPLTLTYLVNLIDIDFNNYDLPANSIGMISDYLECLISIPNTQRQRRIAAAGKIDISDLETHAELMDRKKAIEDSMRASRAIVSPFSFTG
ncbi:hypothetical protein VXS06_14435 [Photobacterium toruni]|uniref:Uncharacterized protein n=1 Tax=Photobacterium toruni TaxID=1935446 RepID=A0ABU6LDF7_9GAMM|nr:hypothetical protein [Photobacterium toruni]